MRLARLMVGVALAGAMLVGGPLPTGPLALAQTPATTVARKPGPAPTAVPAPTMASNAGGGDALSPVVVLNVDGVIGPATAEYVERGLMRAVREHAQLVVLTLDTPGGLDVSMRRIVQHILASTIPVVGYVSPSGARAASAGTFILYACHVAAMAPGTNLGAASPVSIGLSPSPGPASPSDAGGKAAPGALPTDVHERKAMQDAAAYIRGLAQLRGRNSAWGERAVTEAASLSASEAHAQGVVEVLAVDTPDLLRQLDGRAVSTVAGERTLHPAAAPLIAFAPDWHFRTLAVIADPTIAMILMLLGVYGLLFEFGHPGFVFPGVIGALSLVFGLYALHLLPVNYAALALVGLGVAFMLGEVFVPSFGSLGIGGIVAFVAGSAMLIDTDSSSVGIPLGMAIVLALVTAGFVFGVVRLAIRARRRPVVSGIASLVGADGEMLDDATGEGWASIRGETWQVRTAANLTRGQRIRVLRLDGLVPQVVPVP